MRVIWRTVFTAAMVLVYCVWNPISARAQSMSYSAYSDAYPTGDDSGSDVTGYGSLEDYAGCASGSPTPSYMELYSPTRYATGGSSVTMPFDSEEGSWTVVSHFSFTCNCAPYGGSHTFTIGNGTTDLVNSYSARYEWSGDSGNCVAGFAKYLPYQCDHECVQSEKCLPRINGAPEYYNVIGARVFGRCSPGVPYPQSRVEDTICYAGWKM
jgi:hypothetical protein